MKNALFLFLFFSLISCSNEDPIDPNCLEKRLIAFDMVEYTEQDLDCKFYLIQYTFENRDYYIFESQCADIDPFVYDCDGIYRCPDPNNSDEALCSEILQSENRIGIVAIED